jgi:D-alanyl-D-alanine carboxypeptidase
MASKRKAALASFLIAAQAAFAAPSGTSKSASHHSSHMSAANASLKAARPASTNKGRLNPTKPAGIVNLDEESYAVFVPDDGGLKLLAKSPKTEIDAPRALASHVKLLTASCVLEAMRANPALKTKENMGALRRGLLESSNDDMQALARAAAPEPTDESALAMLRAKADSLKLSTYFDVENASGDPKPLKKHDSRHDSYGTIEDVIKIAADLFGNEENRAILAQEVYSNVNKSDHPTNFVLWNSDGVFLATKTATANGETEIASGAGFRTMVSYYDDGQNKYYIFHPNPYGKKFSPSSIMSSIIDQVLRQEGVSEAPRFAAWLTRTEQKQFPTVRAAIMELAQRSQLSLDQTIARFTPPSLPKTHEKSHYNRHHEAALLAAHVH